MYDTRHAEAFRDVQHVPRALDVYLDDVLWLPEGKPRGGMNDDVGALKLPLKRGDIAHVAVCPGDARGIIFGMKFVDVEQVDLRAVRQGISDVIRKESGAARYKQSH